MQNRKRGWRLRRERRILHRLVAAGAIAVLAGCRDDATRLTAPPPPHAAVGSDGTWIVNSLEDPGDGSCSNAECTLREAIAAAQTGERVTFKVNMTGIIRLTAGELLVEQGIAIEGPGADKLTVSGEGLGRVFHIDDVNPVIVSISGVTITRGDVFGGGGGILLERDSRLVLTGSLVTGNRAANGGGIYSQGSLSVAGSTIAANNAMSAGGGIVSEGVLSISRSTISGNNAAQSNGGGVLAACVGACGGATFRSSTITNNDALLGGGGVSLSRPTTFSNTIVAGNRRDGDPAHPEADCADNGHGVSLGNNLTTLNTGCNFTDPSDVLLLLPSQVFTFVLFPALAENGGRTSTHALITRGLAVDAGYCPGEGADQRGLPRPVDDPTMPNALDGCDIGAFEWQPPSTKLKGPKK